jgi:hypothetical protein
MALKSATSAVCQNILVERDGVPSLIRVVDIFTVPAALPSVHGNVLPIPMSLYINIKVSNDDEELHTVAFSLERPDGKSVIQTVTESAAAPVGSFPEADRSIVVAAQVGVEPMQVGVHRFHILFDGIEVSSASFLIKQAASESESEPK